MHPLARPYNCSGALGMRAGDRVVNFDGKRGVADEFLSDGDAFVTWDDGGIATVKWNYLRADTPTSNG